MMTSGLPPTSPSRDVLFAQALNSLTVHVAILDDAGRIVAVNDAWRAFASDNGAACHPSVMEGADYLAASRVLDDAHARDATEGLQRILRGDLDEFLLEYPCHSPTEPRWYLLRATPLRAGSTTGAVIVHSNITQRKLAQQRLSFLAHHDELTGLRNRRGMTEALTSAQPSGRLGVMLVDLDHFKDINDIHGHAAGNDVLCAVADALIQPLSGGSTASRHGGDEFCVAVFDSDPATLAPAAAEICARTRQRLARLPFEHAATVSVGATLVAGDEPLGDALERADQALYAVKGQGRDGFDVH